MSKTIPSSVSVVFFATFLSALLLIGVSLFVLREKSIPTNMSYELKVAAKKSTQSIITDQFLVLIDKKHIAKLGDILGPLGLTAKMPMLNWILVQGKNPTIPNMAPLGSNEADDARLTLSSLLSHPLVLDAHHNYILDNTTIPNNWSFSDDWQLAARSVQPMAMNLAQAWDITKGSDDITIAVVDQFTIGDAFTFDERFPSCADRVSLLKPFASLKRTPYTDPLPHGEIMLHALGACTDRGDFSAGIDWRAKIAAIERPGPGHAQSYIAALFASGIDICQGGVIPCAISPEIQAARVPPDVLLMPFGNDAPDLLQFSIDMITRIQAQGVIVVSGAGNENSNADNFFPSGSPGVLSVGASDKSGSRAWFSNWGPSIDILAPGDAITLIYPNGPKDVAGTSVAAAYVAGAISLMKSLDKHISAKEVKYILRRSASPLSCEHYCPAHEPKYNGSCKAVCCGSKTEACGKFLLDVAGAVEMTSSHNQWPPMLELSQKYLLFLRNEVGPKEISIKNAGDYDAKVRVRIFDDTVDVLPKSFLLSKKGSAHQEQPLLISLTREPFKRMTFKIELIAEINDEIVDHGEFYLEYIPK